MLIDEVREAAEDGEVMKDTTGTCRFCKQILTVRIPDIWTQELANDVAAENMLHTRNEWKH